MLSMLQNDPVVDVTYKNLITRVKRTMTSEQFEMVKRLRVTSNERRVVVDNWNTLPYGYQWIRYIWIASSTDSAFKSKGDFPPKKLTLPVWNRTAVQFDSLAESPVNNSGQ